MQIQRENVMLFYIKMTMFSSGMEVAISDIQFYNCHYGLCVIYNCCKNTKNLELDYFTILNCFMDRVIQESPVGKYGCDSLKNI